MINLNTNLSSIIAQEGLTTSTNRLNQAIERMSTGFKINHASDNAANYSIATQMETQLSAYDIAADNVSMGSDIIDTAEETIDLINSHLERIRNLLTRAANNNYGDISRNAIQQEIDSRQEEIARLIEKCEYNNIPIFKGGIILSPLSTKLGDFGILSGEIGVNINGTEKTVSISSNDTLSTFMAKMEAEGVAAEFDVSTGILSLDIDLSNIKDDKTLQLNGTVGTGILNFLGIESTDGYKTDKLEIENTVTNSYTATESTLLSELGITDGSFSVTNSGVVSNDSVDPLTSTIGDFLAKLNQDYGIASSFSNGVITLNSDKPISGSLADALGIGTTSTSTTITSAQSATSGNNLSYTTVKTADTNTKMSDLGISAGDTLIVRDKDGNSIYTKMADSSFLNSTLGEVLSELKTDGYLSTADINSNGVITLVSTAGNYVEGTVADKLGIGINSSVSNMTTGESVTSSAPLTYGAVVDATESTTLSGAGVTSKELLVDYKTTRVTKTESVNTTTTLTTILAADTKTAVTSFTQITSQAEAEAMGYTWVTTRAELETALNNSHIDKIMLGADIDLSGEDWTPVTKLSCVFDGNGHKISNMTINSSISDCGFFSRYTGSIKNVVFSNATVQNSNESSYTGVIVGFAGSGAELINCDVSHSTVVSDGERVGLLAGRADYCQSCDVYYSTITASNSSADPAMVGSGDIFIDCSVFDCKGLTYLASYFANIISGGYYGNYINSIQNITLACAPVIIENVTYTSSRLYDLSYAILLDNNNIQQSVLNGADLYNIIGVNNKRTTEYHYYTTSTTKTYTTKTISTTSTIDSTATLTVSGSSTFDDMFTSLNPYGLAFTMNDGVISLTSSNGARLYGELADELGLTMSSGDTSAASKKLTRGSIVTLDSSNTSDFNLGLSSNGYITVRNGATTATLTVTSTSTVADVVSFLNSNGQTVNINSGKLTVNGTNNAYILSMSSNLQTALKLQAGEGYTYTTGTITNHTNTKSDAQSVQAVTTLNSANSNSITLLQFGLGNGNHYFTINNGQTVTVKASDTVANMVTNLAGQGITTSINSNGTLTFSGNSSYITGVSSALSEFLGLQAGEGKTYLTSVLTEVSNTASDSLVGSIVEITTVEADLTTNLNSFDTDSDKYAGDFILTIDGENKKLSISDSETIGSFIDKLDDLGVKAFFKNGLLTIDGNRGNVSLSSAGTTSKLESLLGLTYYDKLDNYSSSMNLNNKVAEIAENQDNTPNEIIINAGIYGRESDEIAINTNLPLGQIITDASSAKSARSSLNAVDNAISILSQKQTEYGAAKNRLDSALESIFVNIENLTSSLSTIKDVDMSEVTSEYIRQQILQDASATLLSTANQTPAIALQLL